MTASRRRRLSVLFTPAEIDALEWNDTVVVIVDVLRSTSVIPVGLAAGARAFIPAPGVEEARALRDAVPSSLLCGERNGVVPEGFDLGNSPFEYTPDRVGGCLLVFTSTNGAPLFSRLGAARRVFAGGFVNASALANALLERTEDVLLVPAGKDRRPALEDVSFCGSLTQRLLAHDFAGDDGALMAQAIWGKHANDVHGMLVASAHGAWLVEQGYAADVEFCARADVVEVVPVLETDRLIASG